MRIMILLHVLKVIDTGMHSGAWRDSLETLKPKASTGLAGNTLWRVQVWGP